jgi:hypothetical protein
MNLSHHLGLLSWAREYICSDVVDLLKSSRTDPAIGFVLIAITAGPWGLRFLAAVEVDLMIGLVHDSYRCWERGLRFPLWMKISCCLVWASRAMLIGLEQVSSELVARCLLITQCISVLEREPWFVPHVHPCSRTVLKWSTAWWRGARFYHRRSVDR